MKDTITNKELIIIKKIIIKNKKKRDIINPIVKLKMNFSFPKKERKIKFILMM